jgi:hypothetical protein
MVAIVGADLFYVWKVRSVICGQRQLFKQNSVVAGLEAD